MFFGLVTVDLFLLWICLKRHCSRSGKLFYLIFGLVTLDLFLRLIVYNTLWEKRLEGAALINVLWTCNG